MCWNVAWDYISEIQRDLSSHLVSALHGDLYVPHAAERAAWAIHEHDLNAHRGKGQTPRRLKRPWAGKKPTYVNPADVEMTAERLARRNKLAALF